MKEQSLGRQSETDGVYEKTYIAFPITEGPLLNWLKTINPHKEFFHVTFFFLGTTHASQIEGIRSVLSTNSEVFQNSRLELTGLAMIGKDPETFVLGIRKSNELKNIRQLLEREFRGFGSNNLHFVPHISIEKLKYGQDTKEERSRLLKVKDISQTFGPFTPRSVGVYYRVDGATALLYSKKI